MPPKQKITRDAILETGFHLLKKQGMTAVNARSIAKKLGCSTQPIFSCFAAMEELHRSLLHRASQLYNLYIQEGLKSNNTFKGLNLYYISFAQEEPQLFKLLFIQNSTGRERLCNANAP